MEVHQRRCHCQAAVRLGALLLWAYSPLVGQPVHVPAYAQHIDSLNQLARHYFSDSPVHAEQLAQQALQEARQHGYTRGIVHALRFKGGIALFRGDLPDALAHYDEAISHIQDRPAWQRDYASLLLNKGLVYQRAGNLGQALLHYLEADTLYSQTDAAGEHAKLLNNLAIVHRQLGQYEGAVRIYQKSLAVKEALRDTLGIANTYINLGLAYSYLKDYTPSVDYLRAAQDLLGHIGQEAEAQSVNLFLGTALYEMGHRKEAKAALEAVMSHGLPQGQVYEALSARLSLANLYLEEDDYAAAYQLLKAVEPELGITDFSALKSSFYRMKAYSLNGLGQYASAYQALLAHTAYLDTLQSEGRLKLAKEMEAKYRAKEQEHLIKAQDTRLQQNQRERRAYIGGLLLMILVLLLSYRLLRLHKKSNRLLNEKNAQINKALREKEMLLQEIHHRVKNNLQTISSLLTLQSRQVEDPKALEAIQEGRNRVNAMALIHKNLYQEDGLVGVDAKAYIEKLTESLVENYKVIPQQLDIVKDIDPLKLDVDTIIPLGLIFNELISNALKYAFSNGEPGSLHIALKAEGQGLRLRVADDGKGLPKGFDPQRLDSLGFRLVNAFAQKLDAQLFIQSQKGTLVEVYLPQLNPTQ